MSSMKRYEQLLQTWESSIVMFYDLVSKFVTSVIDCHWVYAVCCSLRVTASWERESVWRMRRKKRVKERGERRAQQVRGSQMLCILNLFALIHLDLTRCCYNDKYLFLVALECRVTAWVHQSCVQSSKLLNYSDCIWKAFGMHNIQIFRMHAMPSWPSIFSMHCAFSFCIKNKICNYKKVTV